MSENIIIQDVDNKPLNTEQITSNEYFPEFRIRKKIQWNSRFHVTSTNNMAKAHPFYRNFFDKPEKANQDSLRFSSLKEKQEENKQHRMQRNLSQAMIIKEFNWNQYFSNMQSKHNNQLHDKFREYFDKPVESSPKGSKVKFKPMEIYTIISPNKQSLKQLNKMNKYTSLKAFNTNKNKKKRYQPYEFEGFRQQSISPDDVMKEQKWDRRIGLPLSKYNESVFPRYKVLFEDL